MPDYYYNLDSHQVEEGAQSPGNELMGPYATREEAQRALAIAASRNEAWDEQDKDWKDGADS
ncbi:SPOR domain-containing protein [Brachybacterium sp. AOP25-B2-12]|uniref:SPOR domain-containing protein n=1 Tax=Brachybacterium sp. AOP25-B2-12 TaxID=3457710 RepID=UPI004034A12B